MAKIVVMSDDGECKVVLSEPDEDGDYTWDCTCGDFLDAHRPIDEAIATAESHIDMGAPGHR